VVPDRLGLAWDAFERLSRGEQREFLNLLREWHLARRIDVLAARGRTYAHRPPVSLEGVSVGDALDRRCPGGGAGGAGLTRGG
jgi:hypothetical protein